MSVEMLFQVSKIIYMRKVKGIVYGYTLTKGEEDVN